MEQPAAVVAVQKQAAFKERILIMAGKPGETERVGVSGEKKARNVGSFVGILLAAIVVLLLVVIGYLALRKEKAVPPATDQTTQPAKQSSVLVTAPSRYV